MESKPEIFFSYAWGDQSASGMNREKIVNDLYESLKADGFNVVRDKNDLRYKGLISALTSRIGRGKFIVVAISDKYLKSTYCMSELLEIYRRSNSDINEMLQKIFPIVLDDAKIYNPEDRVDYLSYWEDKKDELNKELKGIELENVGTFADDLRMYDEITAVIPILSQLLKDINTLNLEALSANNFAEIKRAIINAAGAPGVATESIPTTKTKARLNKFPLWKVLVATSALIALLAVVLHFLHATSTRIRLELSVSEVNFSLPKQQVVTNIIKLASIGASGLENIVVPALSTRREPDSAESPSAVHLSIGATNNPGSLTIDALGLPAGMRMGIRTTDIAGEYRFSFQQKAHNLPVQADGFVKVVLPPNPPEVLHFTTPGVVHLQSGSDGFDLDLNFLDSSNRVFSSPIEADSISLLRIDENFDDENSIVRTVSTILSGTMYYESLDDKKRVLAPGSQARFAESHGTITRLELSGNNLVLTFVGNVRGMTMGDEKSRANIMPTYLEWLTSQLGVPLLLVIVLLIFGLVIGVRRFRNTSN